MAIIQPNLLTSKSFFDTEWLAASVNPKVIFEDKECIQVDDNVSYQFVQNKNAVFLKADTEYLISFLCKIPLVPGISVKTSYGTDMSRMYFLDIVYAPKVIQTTYSLTYDKWIKCSTIVVPVRDMTINLNFGIKTYAKRTVAYMCNPYVGLNTPDIEENPPKPPSVETGTTREVMYEILHKFCDNVYFQPPPSLQMTYPCIRYSQKDVNTRYADDKKHTDHILYELVVIDYDPDRKLASKLYENLRYTTYDRDYIADNMYHTLLTTYKQRRNE